MNVKESAVCLIVALAFAVGGCGEKKEKADQQSEEGGDAKGKKDKKKKSDDEPKEKASDKKDWSKIDRVAFSKLQGILPEALGPLKRTTMGGQTVPDDERPSTEATAEYEAGEKTLAMRIQDSPLEAQESIAAKTGSFKGYPIISEAEADGGAEIRFVVGDRFIVTGNSHQIATTELKSILEKLDLAKLDSWKNDGVKK